MSRVCRSGCFPRLQVEMILLFYSNRHLSAIILIEVHLYFFLIDHNNISKYIFGTTKSLGSKAWLYCTSDNIILLPWCSVLFLIESIKTEIVLDIWMYCTTCTSRILKVYLHNILMIWLKYEVEFLTDKFIILLIRIQSFFTLWWDVFIPFCHTIHTT